MSDDREPYLIAALPKNAREEVRVSISEYRGTTYLDVRIFADTGLPDMVPTGKGVTFAPAKIADLADAIEAAKREAERRGLIPVGG